MQSGLKIMRVLSFIAANYQYIFLIHFNQKITKVEQFFFKVRFSIFVSANMLDYSAKIQFICP